MKNLETKLEAARQLARTAYEAYGLSQEYDEAMTAVKSLAAEVDAKQEKTEWVCEADGKWYV